MPAQFNDSRVVPIGRKVETGERLSLEDGIALYRSPDILGVGFLANLVRDGDPARIAATNFLTVNLMLFFMVLADVMNFLTQLFYYRRGLR